MPTMIFIIVLLGLILGRLILRCLPHRRRHHRQACSDDAHETRMEQCRQVISGKTYNNKPNHFSPYESRAVPNHRLQVTFGIHNAFTSSDGELVKAFRNKTTKLMCLTPDRMERVARFATDAGRKLIHDALAADCAEKGLGQRVVHITSIVQVLTLKIVRLVVFERGEEVSVKDTYLSTLARCINQAWIDSKRELNDRTRYEDNRRLRSSLAVTFGTHNQPGENTLNLILPSFETMWRVVLRALLEVRCTTGLDEPQWREALIAFVKRPNREIFESPITSTDDSKTQSHSRETVEVGPVHIVSEALRLHPPTRRVYRAHSSDPAESHQIIAADLETCHLDLGTWGSDAHAFRPSRWLTATSQQKKAFMPFGHTPFVCPANPQFGPQMIAILTGALLLALEGPYELHWRTETGNGRELEIGVRLDPRREAYEDLELIGQATRA